MIPWPFAKAVMVFGEPMVVPKDASPEEVEALRLTLEEEIHRLHAVAESRVGVRV